MKIKSLFFAIGLAAAACAHADQYVQLNYQTDATAQFLQNFSATLDLSSTQNADGSFNILGASGSLILDGSTATTVAGLGTNADNKFWLNPNLNTATHAYLDTSGLSFLAVHAGGSISNPVIHATSADQYFNAIGEPLHVSVSAVPEPATILLTGAGLSVIFLRRRRQTT